MKPVTENIVQQMARLKADYRADYDGMRPSKFRRERKFLGGSADAHLGYSWVNYWRLRETARDMMRNDSIIAQALERASNNIFRTMFQLEMLTSDKALNKDIDAQFMDWAEDPMQCDARETLTFHEQVKQAWRQCAFDGDVFGSPHEDGYLQWIEGDRCVNCKGTTKNVVHGVLLGNRDQPEQYWFGQNYLPYERLMHIQLVSDTYPVQAKNAAGDKNVFHIFKPSRFSATRGVPLFATCFDIAGMLEDLNFAKLVQAQVVSCIAAFIETIDPAGRPANTNLSGKQSLSPVPGNFELIEELSPGKVPQLPPGKTMKAFSPAVPNAEYFPHVQLLLRIIGANIGLPLSIILLDTSSTNFSGYRGELEQARIGFQDNQKFMINRLYKPTLKWRVRQMIKNRKIKGDTVNRMLKSGELFNHKWIPAGWPYIEPNKDASADATILENNLESPTQLQARKGCDFGDVLRETIRDNGRTILKAIKRAEWIFKQTGEKVTWRDVLNPRGAKISVKAMDQGEATDGEPAPVQPAANTGSQN